METGIKIDLIIVVLAAFICLGTASGQFPCQEKWVCPSSLLKTPLWLGDLPIQVLFPLSQSRLSQQQESISGPLAFAPLLPVPFLGTCQLPCATQVLKAE